MFDNGQSGLRKQPLHHVLVHARGRAQHARAHIRNAGQLKQPLNRPVLAKGPMQHRKHNVKRGLTVRARLPVEAGLGSPAGERRGPRPCASRLRRQERWNPLVQQLGAGRRFRVARAQSPCDRAAFAVEQAVRIARAKPAAFFGDADGHHIELLAIDRLQNRSRREQRDLMLAAAPAKQDTDTKFFRHCAAITTGKEK